MITIRKLRTVTRKKLPLFAAALLIMTGVIGSTVTLSTGQVSADGEVCTAAINDMMTGGFGSNEDFINTIETGDASGHTDLAAIYAAFGLESADYGAFISSARQGIAKKSGEILVDGNVVATEGFSFGRQEVCQGAGPQSMTVGGTTIWGNVNAANFASDDQPVTVLFDRMGAPIFVAINSCGNPSKFKPVKPKFSCDLIEKHPVEGQENTFTFTTQATAENGATIVEVVYDFGDGSAPVTIANPQEPTPPHTFTQSAIVTATVFVSVPGSKDLVPVTSETCQVPVEVKEKVVPPPVTPPKVPEVPLPPQLPRTGVSGALPLFGLAVVGGYFGGRWLMLRPRRTQSVDNH